MSCFVAFHYRSYGTFFYTKIGSIISTEDLPTTNIIVPYFLNIESNLTKTNVHCIIEWIEILNERG